MKEKLTYWSVPIERVDDEERIVEGYAFVNEVVPGEGGMRLKRSAMEGATEDYMKWGAVREMHSASAAGTALSVEWDDKGARFRAKIVDDNAWKKVTERVYKAFSIGVMPTVVRGKDVEQCRWAETSLVDRPKDEGATLDVFRFEMPEAKEEEPETVDCTRISEFVMERGKFADIAEDRKKDTLREASFYWLQQILLWPRNEIGMSDVRTALAEFAKFWDANGLCDGYKRLGDGTVEREQTSETVPIRENLEGKTKKKKCRECGSNDVVDDDEDGGDEKRADFPLMNRLATAESNRDKELERANQLQVRVAELEAKPRSHRPVLFTGKGLERTIAGQPAVNEAERVESLQREMNEMFKRAGDVYDQAEKTRMLKRVTEIKAELKNFGINA